MSSNDSLIHPTAVISPDAELAGDVAVGPYAVVEGNVTIGAGTRIGPHAVIHAFTRLGSGNAVHAHAILGDDPQHLAYDGATTYLEIGDGNVIREMVTVHRSLYAGQSTRVGSNCLLMANSHLGHDCVIGDHVILINNVGVAGHVEIGERTLIGGCAGIHQFVRIGAHAMVAAMTMIRKDVLPYSMIGGEPASHYRLNTVGLRRNGITGGRYRALEKAFRDLRDGRRPEGSGTPELEYLQQWLDAPSKRGVSGFRRVNASYSGSEE